MVKTQKTFSLQTAIFKRITEWQHTEIPLNISNHCIEEGDNGIGKREWLSCARVRESGRKKIEQDGQITMLSDDISMGMVWVTLVGKFEW